MFRVIIAGGRDFNNYLWLAKVMDRLLAHVTDEIVIICGMAQGADRLGERYGKERGYSIRYFPADWDGKGRGAGFIRNVEMAKNTDALAAFWDGQSKGTKHMIEMARKYKLAIRIKYYTPNEISCAENL